MSKNVGIDGAKQTKHRWSMEWYKWKAQKTTDDSFPHCYTKNAVDSVGIPSVASRAFHSYPSMVYPIHTLFSVFLHPQIL